MEAGSSTGKTTTTTELDEKTSDGDDEEEEEEEEDGKEIMKKKKKQSGNVKWFNSSKGFGFIVMAGAQEADQDVFVHQTAIHAQGFRSLQQGESVEFVSEMGDDGRLRALHVTGPNGAYVLGAPRYGSRAARSSATAAVAGPATDAATPATAAAAAAAPATGQTILRPAGCYTCGGLGHISRFCPSLPLRGMPRGPPRGRGGPFPRGGGRYYNTVSSAVCFHCGNLGHIQRNCPNLVRPVHYQT